MSEDRPLNPPILGDFKLKKVVTSPQSWGTRRTKNFGSQIERTLLLGNAFFSDKNCLLEKKLNLNQTIIFIILSILYLL